VATGAAAGAATTFVCLATLGAVARGAAAVGAFFTSAAGFFTDGLAAAAGAAGFFSLFNAPGGRPRPRFAVVAPSTAALAAFCSSAGLAGALTMAVVAAGAFNWRVLFRCYGQ